MHGVLPTMVAESVRSAMLDLEIGAVRVHILINNELYIDCVSTNVKTCESVQYHDVHNFESASHRALMTGNYLESGSLGGGDHFNEKARFDTIAMLEQSHPQLGVNI